MKTLNANARFRVPEKMNKGKETPEMRAKAAKAFAQMGKATLIFTVSKGE